MMIDERTKAAHNRIQFEMYLLGPIVSLGFLILKLVKGTDVLSLLGELIVFAVFAVFCVLIFSLYRQNKCWDERAKMQLFKRARLMYFVQLLAFIPAIVANTFVMLYRLHNVELYRFHFFEMALVHMMAVVVTANIYGMIRMRNEKFISRRAAAVPLIAYRNRLLKICISVTAGLLLFIVVWVVLSYAFAAYESESWHTGLVAMTQVGGMLAIIGIPTCWLCFFQYYGMRKDLAKKEGQAVDKEPAVN